MRVLICGDRNYGRYPGDSSKNPLAAKRFEHKAYKKVLAYVKTLPESTVIIDGMAKGADTLAHRAALACELNWERYPAQWDLFGKAAGPIRNKQMLDEGKPDLVVYFHDDIESGKGTKGMVNIARKRGIEVEKGG